MAGNIYLYIGVMAGVTYLIRLIPLTLLRKEIQNQFIRSFLHYVPYVALSVMTFPAILTATAHPLSAIAGFVTALVVAYRGKSLITVALSACAVVFLLELLVTSPL